MLPLTCCSSCTCSRAEPLLPLPCPACVCFGTWPLGNPPAHQRVCLPLHKGVERTACDQADFSETLTNGFSECNALTEAGCVRGMAQILHRSYTVQCITPDITHHPILLQACGGFRVCIASRASQITPASRRRARNLLQQWHQSNSCASGWYHQGVAPVSHCLPTSNTTTFAATTAAYCITHACRVSVPCQVSARASTGGPGGSGSGCKKKR